jgi:hypothetical protein
MPARGSRGGRGGSGSRGGRGGRGGKVGKGETKAPLSAKAGDVARKAKSPTPRKGKGDTAASSPGIGAKGEMSAPSPTLLSAASKAKRPTWHAIRTNLYPADDRPPRVAESPCGCEEVAGRSGCFDAEICLNRMMQIECGKGCAFGARCLNRGMQKRQYSKCEIRNFGAKGWGLVTLVDLRPGTFIMEYVGEVTAQATTHS